MRFVTFGEIMLRLSPPGHLRLRQTLPGSLDAIFAGAEANVAASLAMLGADVAYVTALPTGPHADACVANLRGLGIDTSAIVRSVEGRLGIFFVEPGANQLPSRVTYDRAGTSIAQAPPDAYDWPRLLDADSWLHITGITPAVSSVAAEATVAAARAAKEAGATVSCDLNYRAKLWNWESGTERKALARRVMTEVLDFVDLLIVNEEDCDDVLGIRAGTSDTGKGDLDVAAYPDAARQVIDRFPNVRRVATTLRQSISASHNNWGAMLYEAEGERALFAPEVDGEYRPYEIRNIVDRVGGGDSFAAGLMFALNSPDYGAADASLRFAAAASCLSHSISGDLNYASRAEIEALLSGAGSGRVVR